MVPFKKAFSKKGRSGFVSYLSRFGLHHSSRCMRTLEKSRVLYGLLLHSGEIRVFSYSGKYPGAETFLKSTFLSCPTFHAAVVVLTGNICNISNTAMVKKGVSTKHSNCKSVAKVGGGGTP